MTKAEYLKRLHRALHQLKSTEIEKSIMYYSEIIDDRIEGGTPPESAADGLEPPEAVAADILKDAPPEAMRRERSAMSIALLIIGAPLWIPILIAFLIILLALYIVVWSVVISFYAAELSLAVSGLAGLLGALFIAGQNVSTALLLLGGGLICGGIALLAFIPLWKLAKLVVIGTGRVCSKAWRYITGKAGDLI